MHKYLPAPLLVKFLQTADPVTVTALSEVPQQMNNTNYKKVCTANQHVLRQQMNNTNYNKECTANQHVLRCSTPCPLPLIRSMQCYAKT
jgi:hypothetical protein